MIPVTQRRRIKRVQVILKVAERCNLACTYCYYFEGGDQTFREKPAVMAVATAEALGDFLSRGIDDMGLDDVWISLHGGEPFMLKPAVLDSICTALRQKLEHKCRLVIGAQTNGTHVTPALLEVINKHRLEVSVSVDGLAEAHDRERKDHRGRGSYERIKQNFAVLADNASRNGLPYPEIIAVLDARNNYVETIEGLHRDLRVNYFNFLLPDCNHDDGIPHGFSAAEYGRVLCEIFESWKGSEHVGVREIENIIRRFQVAVERDGNTINKSRPGMRFIENQVIVVRSDGELQIDDTYIPASDWRNTLPRVNLTETTLLEYLSAQVFDEIEAEFDNAPEVCRECIWQNICNGGDLENRYSKASGFNNPSVYCEGLKMLYHRIALFLRRSGYPAHVLADRLRKGPGRHEYRYAR